MNGGVEIAPCEDVASLAMGQKKKRSNGEQVGAGDRVVRAAFWAICKKDKRASKGKENLYLAGVLGRDVRTISRWKRDNRIPATAIEVAKKVAEMTDFPLEKLL